MNNVALNSKSKVLVSPPPAGAVLRDLIAVAPIVILVSAVRAALRVRRLVARYEPLRSN